MKKDKLPKKNFITKQKGLFYGLILAVIAAVGCSVYIGDRKDEDEREQIQEEFNSVSEQVNADNIRLSQLESLGDVLGQRVHSLEKDLVEVKEEKNLLDQENSSLHFENEVLEAKINSIIQQQAEVQVQEHSHHPVQLSEWTAEGDRDDKNVLFEIPAGTVVKAVLVSGADCSVAVQKPTGPSMMLLRPLDNGRLPRKVRVPLKGSVIIGNAIGDIASERVYVRGERMTLVQPNGDFVETEVSAYISGEDGREGMRGVVVDRSGKILTRAGFAAFMQGLSGTIQSAFAGKSADKVAKDQNLLSPGMLGDTAMQGATSSLDRLSSYYVRRAEQLQPTIQIAAGRIVDIVFTKTVKVGEADLKKKFEHERQMKRKAP